MSLLQNSNAISSGGYNIANSLRFQSASSTYLARTPASAGNRKTWTLSMWVKRGQLGTTQDLFGANNDGDEFRFTTTDTLRYYSYVSPTTYIDLNTTQVFRDPSAWYHLLLVIDTTQATAANRAKLYVNGSQVTALGTATYPSQNYDTGIDTNTAHYIGRYSAGANNFVDGYMTEVNFIDGQALTPSSFGENNATTGQWVAKKYTGTYGTNGFYLPFTPTTQATGFNTVTWSATGSAQSIKGVGFSPDLVWFKRRNVAENHWLVDSVRGVGNGIYSNLTNAEASQPTTLTSFDSDGFSLGADITGFVNTAGSNYVGWCWDAGSSTVSNTNGSITSSVRANTTSGFSIVTYTGNGGTNATVGHGLGVAPQVILAKVRSTSADWECYFASVGATKVLHINTNQAPQTLGHWGNTSPTSSVFTVNASGTGSEINGNGSTYVAYCFSEIAGYSKFGSYTGTGTAGNTVTTGFRPAFLLIKASSSTGDWVLVDNTRSPDNGTSSTPTFFANANFAESSFAANDVNFTDTGFVLNHTAADGYANASGVTYIYMAFAETRNAQWNFDGSGNKNNWVPTNFNTSAPALTSYSLMNDVPSGNGSSVGGTQPNSNYCVLNKLSTTSTLADGNLKYSNGNSYCQGSIFPTSGLFYAEIVASGAFSSYGFAWGIASGNANLSTSTQPAASTPAGIWYVYSGGGLLSVNSDGSSTNQTNPFTIGATWQIAIDTTNGYCWLGQNNTWYSSTMTATGNPATGANPTFTMSSLSTRGGFSVICGNNTAGGTFTWNFGQRTFVYTPPSGFKALCTANLPASTIVKGNEYMDARLWNGNGSTQTISGYGFQPDFLWGKNRNDGAGVSHNLYDAVRGARAQLVSNTTAAEVTRVGDSVVFNSSGFVLDASYNNINNSSSTNVGWAWNAGGSTVTNTNGSISSQVRANPTAGVSVVTFTSTGSAGAVTVGHGLGVAPAMVITKERGAVGSWGVYHKGLATPASQYLNLQTTSAATTNTSYWGNTNPSSTVVTLGNGTMMALNTTMVMYCFAEIAGFSKFGSYTGNGSADGVFTFTGFTPRWVLIKQSSTSGNNWQLIDTARETTNPNDTVLFPNTSGAEGTLNATIDVLSNGFKIRTTDGSVNTNGATYIYACFASNPFQNSNAF